MKQIREYTIDEQPIGSGGMGRVYRGYDAAGLPVAIKEILPEFVNDMEFRARLESEIKILKGLNNDNITKIHAYFEYGDNLYIVMELVEGVNIEQWIERNGVMNINTAAECMANVLTTMQYVHEQGIIHRDIKPSNIMVRNDGTVCILDFGIAKDTHNQHGGTTYGTIIGTSGYMSPEQVAGFAVDHRTDIYALGCLMFYMLTGRHAVQKQQSELAMHKTIQEQPLPMLKDYITPPQGAQEVLNKATDKNMLRRYQSCNEFLLDIEKQCNIQNLLTTVTGAGHGINPSVSIGREGCDVSVYPHNLKISRHHADVQLNEFTGGAFYVWTDTSTNGTLINGRIYTRGMSVNLPAYSDPEIFMAGDPDCPLDWELVRHALSEKFRLQGEQEYPQSHLQPQMPGQMQPGPEMQEQSRTATSIEVPAQTQSMGFGQAISTCFRKYADFSGRASRAEYWWFALFNVLVNTALFSLSFVIGEIGLMLYGLYGLATLLPGLAVCVRRLHDVDTSGLNLLWLWLPIANIFLLIKLCTAGTPGTNRFGNPV